MTSIELIGLFASVIAVLGAAYTFVKKVLLPWLRKSGIISNVQDPQEPVTKLRLSWQDIGVAVDILADDARAFGADGIFAINRGGAIIGGILAKRLDLPGVRHLDVDSNRTADMVRCHEFDSVISPRKVLVVDDLARTGRNLAAASDFVASKTGADIRTAIILDIREDRRDPAGVSERRIDKHVFHSFLTTVRLPWDKES